MTEYCNCLDNKYTERISNLEVDEDVSRGLEEKGGVDERLGSGLGRRSGRFVPGLLTV